MNNTKLIALIPVLYLCLATPANAHNMKEETPASDSRIEYTGRVLKTENGVSFDWSGVYTRIKFEGSSLSIKCSDTKGDWFNYWIDQEMTAREEGKFHVHSKDTVINLASHLKKGSHEIIIQKRTEGEQGCFTLQSILTEKPLLQAEGRKDRHIEFIGDSYTCGYGTESLSRNDPFLAGTENCNLTYAAICARFFNADFNLISHSGQGVCRNYDDFRPGWNMPDRYRLTFDMKEGENWSPENAGWRPDIVVIYLGTNDFSTGKQPLMRRFADRYLELMKQVKAFYGDEMPIICMASKADDLLFDYIRYTCRTSGIEDVHYMGVTESVHNSENELGASWHPNYMGHKKVASCLIPYISTVTGWEMEEKPYK